MVWKAVENLRGGQRESLELAKEVRVAHRHPASRHVFFCFVSLNCAAELRKADYEIESACWQQIPVTANWLALMP